MKLSLSFHNTFFRLLIPVFLLLAVVYVSTTSLLLTHPDAMSLGITLDLLLTIPLVYFLCIRSTPIPKTTVVPVMVLGLGVGFFILPQNHQEYLMIFKIWILPFLELLIIGYVIYTVGITAKRVRQNQQETLDFFTAAKQACKAIIPNRLAVFVATELAVFYYGFFHWKKVPLSKNHFTYHKNSGSLALLAVVIFLVLIETAILHLLLMNWNITVAWVLSGLSIYTSIQLFGFLKSLTKRPITVTEDSVLLRYGMLSETTIAMQNIKSVELSSLKRDTTVSLSPLNDLEEFNVVIHLHEEQQLNGVYGLKKVFSSIAFFVDDKEQFKSFVEQKLRSSPQV